MTKSIDVPRLIRICTFLLCLIAAALVYFAYAPVYDAASERVDDVAAQQKSDTIMESQLASMRRMRDGLAQRYAHIFAQNPESLFLRDLGDDVARHGITLVSTHEDHTADTGSGSQSGAKDGPDHTQLSVELRGSYRNLLAAIGELSLGPEIVRVDVPALHRDQDDVVAIVPVTIFQPTAQAPIIGTGP